MAHVGVGSMILMMALALQWTTQPKQRKAIDAALERVKARRPKFIYRAREEADVDAEGSDEEAPEVRDGTMRLGPGMRFLNEELEEEWEKDQPFLKPYNHYSVFIMILILR